MDASDVKVSDGVMVALLPITSDWCRLELPHMTLVYAGSKDDLPQGAFNAIAKDASMLATLCSTIHLRVMGTEVFGDEEKVDVLRLQPTSELLAMRRAVERWNASEFPFKPHATIGPAGTFLEFPPRMLAFDRIFVGWGNDGLTFWLRKGF